MKLLSVPLVPHNFPNPVEVEEALAARLRTCRLVFEVLDEATVAQCDGVIAWASRLPGDRLPLLVARYQTVLACHLVSEAITAYRGGALWPRLRIWTALEIPEDQAGHKALGESFIKTLKSHRLDTFEFLAQEGLRYVTPILAHAGIPQYCVGDFFHRLLIRDLRRGLGASAGELLAAWRARQTAFQGIDVPVKRFVLYGGSPAADLVDRCIDFLADASSGGEIHPGASGLPRHIVEGLRLSSSQQAAMGGFGPGQKLRLRTLPIPHVQIDPWETLGPVIELPPLPHDLADASWFVEDGAGAAPVQGSTLQLRRHRIGPARAWAAELRSKTGTLRTSVFERLPETGVAVFDPETGRLARDPHVVPWSSAWILAPSDTTLRFRDAHGRDLPPSRNELPPLAGVWRGHSVGEYSLAGVAMIEASRPSVAGVRLEGIRVLRLDQLRPSLSGALVTGVVTEDGLPVYAEVPSIQFPVGTVGSDGWKTQIRVGDKTIETTAAQAGHPTAELLPWLLDVAVARIQVRATGPIGSDLRADFVVVRGLAVSRPSTLILPGRHTEARVSLRASDGVNLLPAAGGAPTSIPVGPEDDVVGCFAAGGEERVLLLVSVPRLTWAVARSGTTEHRLASTVDTLAMDELADDGTATGAAAIIVSTHLPGMALRLVLKSGGVERDSMSQTTSRDGRAAFLLGRFRDSAVALGVPSLEIDLVAVGRTIPVAKVVAQLRLSHLKCELVDGPQQQDMSIAFDATVQFGKVEVRLWSMNRPWERVPSRVVAIPSGRSVSATRPIPGGCPAGRYLVEVAIHDDWQSPIRPGLDAPNTLVCSLGDLRAQKDQLRRSAQSSAVAALELLLLEGDLIRTLTAEEVAEITPFAVHALLDALARGDDVRLGPLRALCGLLRRNPITTVAALTTAHAGGTVQEDTYLQATILLLPVTASDADQTWDSARAAWATLAPLAAQLDVPRSVSGDADAVARCEEFLGWSPSNGGAFVDGHGTVAPQQALLVAEPDVLKRIRVAADLMPGALLTADEFSTAGLEWVLGGERAEEWWKLHQSFCLLSPPEGTLARQHFERRAAAPGVSAWANLPQASLVASLALLEGRDVARAQNALVEACRFAPRLVAFDLALAAVLQAATKLSGDKDSHA